MDSFRGEDVDANNFGKKTAKADLDKSVFELEQDHQNLTGVREGPDYDINIDRLVNYVGPIASYKKHRSMQIWVNQESDPIFADEAVFLNIQKNSKLIDWMDGRYAMEQNNLAVGEDEGEVIGNDNGPISQEDIWIKIDF